MTLLAYPGAGHGAFGRPFRPGDPRRDRLKGEDLANDRAPADGWPRVMAFPKQALAGPAESRSGGPG